MNASYYTARRGHRRNAHACRYPNAASSRYFADRLADAILCAASCIGIVTVVFFIITM